MNIDPRTFRLVAGLLGAAFIIILVSMAVLSGVGKEYPGVFDNILTGLLTGLLGLLISSRSEEPVDVKVTNQPVATTDVPPPKRTTRRRDTGLTVVGVVLIVVIVLFALGLGIGAHPLWFLLLLLCLVVVLL